VLKKDGKYYCSCKRGERMSETHLSDLKYRMMTIDLLRMAKRSYTYRELSGKTNLPVTVLSRYVKGHVLPSSTRARLIWKKLEKLVGLEEEIRKRIRFDENGYFDNTPLISDPKLLQQSAQHIFSKFAGRRITRILTPAVDGIPLATIISATLGVEFAIAKTTKEVGIRTFVEETFIPGRSAMIITYYVPRHVIKRGDSVLIVDDVITTGETLRAMTKIVTKSRAEVAGIYALVAIGDRWKEQLKDLNVPIEVALKISRRRRK
jgi:adenine phosphoribosyltransferase